MNDTELYDQPAYTYNSEWLSWTIPHSVKHAVLPRIPARPGRIPLKPLLFLSHSLSGGTEKAAPFIWDAAGQHQKLYSLSRHVSHVRERCSLRFFAFCFHRVAPLPP